MDRSTIDREHLIARYIAGQLDGPQESAFEEYAKGHPDIYREIENIFRLKEGLALLAGRGELGTMLHRRAWRWGPMLSAAVAALLLVVLGIWIWQSKSPSREPILAVSPLNFVSAGRRPLSVAATYHLIRSRGESSVIELEPTDSHVAIEFRILPSVYVDGGIYRVDLKQKKANGDEIVVAHLEHLISNDDRYVTVYLNAAMLVPGRYKLLLQSEQSSERDVDTFAIQVK